ncbi:DUF202 domain-containing protein [Oscillatoriales cyanobacterium LEGE 11467]|uniref:DUF202 domain-containing protein n=1 Tax=Zarconia navalis LEGE 11467 TaxID=1828826 RepID=A0A928W3Q4_9CYAN|nr:DUF202 domain-containing protein [Zarconia navalis]MBE9042695.1 DUF202 domain-containing protein [Zarconia navalis LEGE 11467]
MSNLELAKKRNRAAAERTLMAWIRTSISLISFGFGIDKIVSVLNEAVGVNNPIRFTRILGLAFVSLGTLAMLGATVQHRQELRNIRKENYTYVPDISISFIVSIALFGIGLFAFFGILLSI